MHSLPERPIYRNVTLGFGRHVHRIALGSQYTVCGLHIVFASRVESSDRAPSCPDCLAAATEGGPDRPAA